MLTIAACAMVFPHEIAPDDFSRNDFEARYERVPSNSSPVTLRATPWPGWFS
jgi:hypothetical protein